MKLSINTAKLEDKYGLKNALKMIKDAGFDAYDISLYRSMRCDDHFLRQDNYMDTVAEIKKYADSLGLLCNQAHSPFPSQYNGYEKYNKESYKLTVRCLETAAYLGADFVVVHPIKDLVVGGSIFDGVFIEPFKDEDTLLRANVDFFNRLIPYCEKYGIKIALENLFMWTSKEYKTLIPSGSGTGARLSKYVDTINSDYVAACLDTGHNAVVGENVANTVRTLGKERLMALHVQDNHLKRDDHILPYMGEIEWEEVLKALGEIDYRGDFTFETSSIYDNLPKELVVDGLSFVAKVGRYMMSRIEEYRKN